jgi:peptide chain release factor 2
MDALKKRIAQLKAEVDAATDRIKLQELTDERADLRQQMSQADFWQDTGKAQDVSKKEASLNKRIEPWEILQKQAGELAELANLNDPAMKKELEEQLSAVDASLSALKKELRFQGPYDDHDVILSIYAGAGGTDAQDWAQMLLRMYVRWAEKNGVQVETIEQSAGEEAGIKSVTLKLTGGSYLYGKLAGEHGVHRLVRLSPFNADHLRQTSFAKVEIMPSIDRPEEAEIDEKDLKIDVFRAGGHGGQSVNTTDSAVRVTHIPTGLTVAIQNERSQIQNKETAMSILRSRLISLQLEQHAENLAELKGPNQSAEWGNQIRSYVLHPYNMVKDLRTNYETSDTDTVLGGELDPFINAWLEK